MRWHLELCALIKKLNSSLRYLKVDVGEVNYFIVLQRAQVNEKARSFNSRFSYEKISLGYKN